MVRLKEIFCILFFTLFYISIPYGAIIIIQRYKTFLEKPNFLDTILYVFLLIFINFVYK